MLTWWLATFRCLVTTWAEFTITYHMHCRNSKSSMLVCYSEFRLLVGSSRSSFPNILFCFQCSQFKIFCFVFLNYLLKLIYIQLHKTVNKHLEDSLSQQLPVPVPSPVSYENKWPLSGPFIFLIESNRLRRRWWINSDFAAVIPSSLPSLSPHLLRAT